MQSSSERDCDLASFKVRQDRDTKPGLSEFQAEHYFNSTFVKDLDFIHKVAFNPKAYDLKTPYGPETAELYQKFMLAHNSDLLNPPDLLVSALIGAAVQLKIYDDLTVRKNLALIQSDVERKFCKNRISGDELHYIAEVCFCICASNLN